jgi:hypothetical protein
MAGTSEEAALMAARVGERGPSAHSECGHAEECRDRAVAFRVTARDENAKRDGNPECSARDLDCHASEEDALAVAPRRIARGSRPLSESA